MKYNVGVTGKKSNLDQMMVKLQKEDNERIGGMVRDLFFHNKNAKSNVNMCRFRDPVTGKMVECYDTVTHKVDDNGAVVWECRRKFKKGDIQ